MLNFPNNKLLQEIKKYYPKNIIKGRSLKNT